MILAPKTSRVALSTRTLIVLDRIEAPDAAAIEAASTG